jgi:threonine synthase
LRYVSTRAQAPVLDFAGALLTGLARDGGLYVPEAWPLMDQGVLRGMRGRAYADIAFDVIRPFVGSLIEAPALRSIIDGACGAFRHQAVTPLKQIGENLWLLELFHGPTLAFKDVALQLVGRLYDHILARSGQRVTIIGATSGDTGSAALEACRDRAAIDIFILHPHGRTSEVQRRQMTTIDAPNVFNVAIDGTFDDCQDIVKALFNDHDFRDRVNMSAVNSINWARVMAQIVYYFVAALALGAPDRRVGFAVPSGNFGNAYAGYAATRLGLEARPIIVGSNANDILARFFTTGKMRMAPVRPTLSPSMDIQVSSNLERLLFELHDRDGVALGAAMKSLRDSGAYAASSRQMGDVRALFRAASYDDAATLSAMRDIHRLTGEIVDPHSAIGVKAAIDCKGDEDLAMIALATAHPAKFPDAVERATGIRPPLPGFLADLLERRERVARLPNDARRVREFVLFHARSNGAPA